MSTTPSRPRLPQDAGSRDLQSVLGRTRAYGVTTRDPERPVEGWWWIRTDLTPPQLRMKTGGVTYKIDFTAV